MLPQQVNWQCSTIQYSKRETDFTVWHSQSHSTRKERRQYKSLGNHKRHTLKHTHIHTRRLNDDNVWHFWHCQRVAGKEERGGDERQEERREKKRSLMIKLSPDLAFDRGRSRTATTRRSLVHIDAHTHSPSDKPNYDPVRQPNSQKTV